MSLQIKYSTEIAKELGKIAVYLPGEIIHVGDIIKFPYGKARFLKKEAPVGAFTKISSLKNLDVNYLEDDNSGNKHSYKFSSKNSVKNITSANTKLDLADELPSTDGEITLQFTSEGSIYFHALECYKKQISDIAGLENEIISKSKVLLWDNTYLVTSVTYASNALIMQSRSKNSEITLAGNVNGLKNSGIDISASTTLNIKSQNGDFFIKDWSRDVSVFMELMKFEKETFQAINKNVHTKEFKGRLVPVEINSLII